MTEQKNTTEMDTPQKKSHASAALRFILFFIPLLLLIGLLAGGVYYWLERQATQGAVVLQLETTLNTISKENQRYQQDYANLQHDILQLQTVMQAQRNILANLEQTPKDSDWVLAEVEYLLRLAQYYYDFMPEKTIILKLLRNADQQLASTNNPLFANTRTVLHQEILAYEALPRQDTVGVVAQLVSLTNQLDSMQWHSAEVPMVIETQPTVSESTTPWREQLRDNLAVLGKLITIRRHDEVLQPLLTEQNQVVILQLLKLEFAKAQWAVLQRDQHLYNLSLMEAQSLIKQYFDNQQATFLKQQVTELQGIILNPELPSIANSYIELQKVIDKAKE